jgi:hypothetical protein
MIDRLKSDDTREARRRLLAQLRDGQIDLSEAEEIALAHGYRLNPSAPPDEFEPLNQSDWSMPMALAWISFRQLSAVRFVWDLFRQTQFEFKKVTLAPSIEPRSAVSSPTPLEILLGIETVSAASSTRHGWELSPLAPITVRQIMNSGSPWGDDFEGTPFEGMDGFYASYRKLLQALAAGQVKAKGGDLRSSASPSASPISPTDWAVPLVLSEYRGLEAWGFSRDQPIYINVFIDQVSLLEHFPAPTPETLRNFVDLHSTARDELEEHVAPSPEPASLASPAASVAPETAHEARATEGLHENPLIQDTIYHSGAPGRPTSMHLIEAELDRRIMAGATFSSIASAAAELAHWLAQTHPNAPKATPKAIKNRLAGKIRPALTLKS